MKLSIFTRKLLTHLESYEYSTIVIFSALWPMYRLLDDVNNDLAIVLIDELVNMVGSKKNIIMPTFTSGYHNGVCNLNNEKSQTGILSETFRNLSCTERSLSAFFSFSISGPDKGDFVQLQPDYCWGEGSTFEWFENDNALFLMLGVHPTHCSYLHRVEWIHRDIISYREIKEFNGNVILGNRSIKLTEKLFVRKEPNLFKSNFTKAYEYLVNGGLMCENYGGVSIATMKAKDMKSVFSKFISASPTAVLDYIN